MNLTWAKDDDPHWDADRQRLFGAAELAAVGMPQPVDGTPVSDEWWRICDGDGDGNGDGEVLGYGWLDSEWGDAQISFLVAPAHRGRGIGAFALDRLEDEARRRGLNYIYNVVPAGHPDPAWMTHWLSLHGFRDAGRGELRRQVRAAVPSDRA